MADDRLEPELGGFRQRLLGLGGLTACTAQSVSYEQACQETFQLVTNLLLNSFLKVGNSETCCQTFHNPLLHAQFHNPIWDLDPQLRSCSPRKLIIARTSKQGKTGTRKCVLAFNKVINDDSAALGRLSIVIHRFPQDLLRKLPVIRKMMKEERRVSGEEKNLFVPPGKKRLKLSPILCLLGSSSRKPREGWSPSGFFLIPHL